MSKYTVAFYNSSVPDKNIEADDVQITAQTIKFLNGKGSAATLVAYFPTESVVSVEVVK